MNPKALLEEPKSRKNRPDGQPFYHSILRYPKHDFAGFWSRRISGEHRLIYRFEADLVYVLQCRFHYTKK